LRGLGDRLHEAGRAVIYVADVKNEFSCLSEDTLVKTRTGNKSINNLSSKDEVLGFNFDRNSFQWCSFTKYKTGKKLLFSMELADGSTVQATADHKFFVQQSDGSIIEKELSNIRAGECIVKM
jgi:intein/homing endonuclease